MSGLHKLTPLPPMGWNSFDCYGCSANERVLLENLESFAEKLKPAGYEYFVLDAGWYAEYPRIPGEEFPMAREVVDVRLDEYGRLLPSNFSFPNGLQHIIDKVHSRGLKFGIHHLRGLPQKAIDLKLPVTGSDANAADIADMNSRCPWCEYMYGIDMSKAGAQEYYDGIFELMAEWEVDFVKYDDIISHPDEIKAVIRAAENCGRDIGVSLSPGGRLKPEYFSTYRQANLCRITHDIWDRRKDIDDSFERWELCSEWSGGGFWADLDMIPFGRLMVWNPQTAGRKPNELLGGHGFSRMDRFSSAQKRTFISMRALAASPLFMGGDLPATDDYSFELITNRSMIECDQNGICGKLFRREGKIDIWKTPHNTLENTGWLGVFNRDENEAVEFTISPEILAVPSGCTLEDIWTGEQIEDFSGARKISLGPDDVFFVRYR